MLGRCLFDRSLWSVSLAQEISSLFPHLTVESLLIFITSLKFIVLTHFLAEKYLT